MGNKKCPVILYKTYSTLSSNALSLGEGRGRGLISRRIKQDIILFQLLTISYLAKHLKTILLNVLLVLKLSIKMKKYQAFEPAFK